MNIPTCIAPKCEDPRTVGGIFCDRHMLAPAAQRGGWLSAEKRRRTMSGTAPVASKEAPVDASNIATRLWVGSKPPFDRDLPAFDMLVLCAQEIQPDRMAFSRRIVRVPIPDATLSQVELRRVSHAAKEVAKAMRSGQRVLVTCAAGLNRSALVASLGLGIVSKLTGPQIVSLVRQRRSEHALHNQHFVDIIHRFVASIRRYQAPRDA